MPDGSDFNNPLGIQNLIQNPVFTNSQPILLQTAEFAAAAWAGLIFEGKYGCCDAVKSGR